MKLEPAFHLLLYSKNLSGGEWCRSDSLGVSHVVKSSEKIKLELDLACSDNLVLKYQTVFPIRHMVPNNPDKKIREPNRLIMVAFINITCYLTLLSTMSPFCTVLDNSFDEFMLFSSNCLLKNPISVISKFVNLYIEFSHVT